MAFRLIERAAVDGQIGSANGTVLKTLHRGRCANVVERRSFCANGQITRNRDDIVAFIEHKDSLVVEGIASIRVGLSASQFQFAWTGIGQRAGSINKSVHGQLAAAINENGAAAAQTQRGVNPWEGIFHRHVFLWLSARHSGPQILRQTG